MGTKTLLLAVSEPRRGFQDLSHRWGGAEWGLYGLWDQQQTRQFCIEVPGFTGVNGRCSSGISTP